MITRKRAAAADLPQNTPKKISYISSKVENTYLKSQNKLPTRTELKASLHQTFPSQLKENQNTFEIYKKNLGTRSENIKEQKSTLALEYMNEDISNLKVWESVKKHLRDFLENHTDESRVYFFKELRSLLFLNFKNIPDLSFCNPPLLKDILTSKSPEEALKNISAQAVSFACLMHLEDSTSNELFSFIKHQFSSCKTVKEINNELSFNNLLTFVITSIRNDPKKDFSKEISFLKKVASSVLLVNPQKRIKEESEEILNIFTTNCPREIFLRSLRSSFSFRPLTSVQRAKLLILQGIEKQGEASCLELKPEEDADLIGKLKRCLRSLTEKQKDRLIGEVDYLIFLQCFSDYNQLEYYANLKSIKDGVEEKDISSLDFKLLYEIVLSIPNEDLSEFPSKK